MNPKDILRHELIGLKVEIVHAKNKSMIGIKGKVVDETRKTLIIEKDSGKEVVIPKDIAIFLFHLDNCKVKVDGRLLIGRPEERLKKKIKILYPY
ncbi:ribonuclease P protein component 1 [Methanocaldococcus villosus KIN24-T80]|uniref:Ribonuclease P protein component 1 n=1 Tax=Methanocaldococcus villosus KIN24-T80 TaxID=1069083 RepID=N6VSM3_9EURY|nr:ribonuclease P protein component 1 [Methanocaldococcus villosus]ENN96176.1 ribonuclease P protein component 1 [Methanocaldococcus villosus KIN24-T80]